MHSLLREALDEHTARLRADRDALEAASDAELVEQLFTLEQAFGAHSDALRAVYDDLTATLTVALRRWVPDPFAEGERRECGDA